VIRPASKCLRPIETDGGVAAYQQKLRIACAPWDGELSEMVVTIDNKK
jgi:hypothetical protein